jgi:hypothetical protein
VNQTEIVWIMNAKGRILYYFVFEKAMKLKLDTFNLLDKIRLLSIKR